MNMCLTVLGIMRPFLPSDNEPFSEHVSDCSRVLPSDD